ncbi:hypothetical protein BDV95DRAFT_317347 [Massariosphaeria phaeospora]|uniref:Secreted protein n=1 Tax=Massariosphaeria phaeospora TaxID=100035 RepID=A0A7C8IBJ4_9PLEO|nr:hypothetical protein BDV95DRAFT_317347 [Massariosphaeria phaeospora]
MFTYTLSLHLMMSCVSHPTSAICGAASRDMLPTHRHCPTCPWRAVCRWIILKEYFIYFRCPLGSAFTAVRRNLRWNGRHHRLMVRCRRQTIYGRPSSA